jgi:hypothetical protein
MSKTRSITLLAGVVATALFTSSGYAGTKIAVFLTQVKAGKSVKDAGLGAIFSRGVDLKLGFGCPTGTQVGSVVKEDFDYETWAYEVGPGESKDILGSDFIPGLDTRPEVSRATLIVDTDYFNPIDTKACPSGYKMMLIEEGETRDSLLGSVEFFKVIYPKLEAMAKQESMAVVDAVSYTIKASVPPPFEYEYHPYGYQFGLQTAPAKECGADCEVEATVMVAREHSPL